MIIVIKKKNIQRDNSFLNVIFKFMFLSVEVVAVNLRSGHDVEE